MKELISFIKTKTFWMHLSLALVSLFICFFVLIKSLASYTDHGEFVKVPDFTGKRVVELGSFVKEKEVSFEIVDSLYDPSKAPGTVLSQDPFPESKVKHNRTVYLYVTSMVPPNMVMPKLIDRSERQAKLLIDSYGLKLGKVTTKNADCNGCVVEQYVEGKLIEPGQIIRKGSKIDLVIGVKEYYAPASIDTLAGQTPTAGLDFDDGE